MFFFGDINWIYDVKNTYYELTLSRMIVSDWLSAITNKIIGEESVGHYQFRKSIDSLAHKLIR